jgi:predicted metal-binding protein
MPAAPFASNVSAASAELADLIRNCGFSPIGHFDPAGLVARTEVREMCSADSCSAFGKSWLCPPACGSLESYQKLFGRYRAGYLFQTIIKMEDPFDYYAIERGTAEHKRRFNALAERVVDSERDILLLSAGTCTLCEACAYPDAPCRFPDKAFPSMEATGLLVSDVCKMSGIPYYHGTGTIAFCSCALE